jgi:hypothetical protein
MSSPEESVVNGSKAQAACRVGKAKRAHGDHCNVSARPEAVRCRFVGWASFVCPTAAVDVGQMNLAQPTVCSRLVVYPCDDFPESLESS